MVVDVKTGRKALGIMRSNNAIKARNLKNLEEDIELINGKIALGGEMYF